LRKPLFINYLQKLRTRLNTTSALNSCNYLSYNRTLVMMSPLLLKVVAGTEFEAEVVLFFPELSSAPPLQQHELSAQLQVGDRIV